ITVRRSVFIVPIKALFALQGLYHKVVEGGDAKAQLLGADDYLIFKPGAIDVSKWKKMDSRSMGITQKMIPAPPYTVLQILRSRVGWNRMDKKWDEEYNEVDLYHSAIMFIGLIHPLIADLYTTTFFTGFEAYLVGGCVRDLLLKRPPKDFDVITTADLNQVLLPLNYHNCDVFRIRKQFHRNEVVGSRFPVTSFDTLAKDAEGKEKFLISHMPRGSDKLDLLRTLVPAQLSFTEDSARILRGLRIAARLGLSLSKEIKSAILKNGSSISSLGQFRITMELNYMLSFGAAESSFSLLHKYHLLEILLPSQAAYISQQVTRSGQSSMMLMVFISKYKGNSTRQLFHVLAHKVETYEKGRTSFEINYDLLGKGDSLETRFVLGKIILDTMGCGVHRDSDPNEDNYDGSFSPNNDHLMNKKEDRKQPPFSSNLVLQQRSAPKKPKLIAKLCSIMQQRPKLDEFQDELGDLQEGVSTKHMEVFDISSDPENEDGKMYKPEISMPQSPVRNLIRMLETVIDDDAKSPSQLDSQNLEERLEGNTEVELDQSIAEHQRERNETGFDSLLWFVQTNCNRAIEEARDSPADMRKLNKFLDRFVDEQVQIKKVKKQLETYDKVTSIHAFQTGGKQLEASSLTSSIGNEQIESEQSEASSLTSSIGSQQIGGEQPEASSLVSANRKLRKATCRVEPESRMKYSSYAGEINVSKWKKMDSRSLGITRSMLPSSPFTVLKILRTRGFEAYLVGGCVRDLLLKRTPRDFDVITTADLHQIRKQFHNCHIVGRKFPICRVHMKGSVIEVSSFKTSAKHSEDKEKFLVSQVPRGCDRSDLNLWKNCMHRDFTVNSLFFDPVIHKIYDYSNGMKDLLELKLRTLVPAHLSFSEDCARILRGLRIAARLGLSFSKDTETAIHKQASSILVLSESRIMMEIDLMLSFGASESSLRLLHRFRILEMLLPLQVIHDQIGLLAFHQALLDKPQDPFVVLNFASVLYHQDWQGGLQFARQCGRAPVSFEPELSEPCGSISDDELSIKVRQLALQVLDSIEALVETDSLHKKMSKFPGFPCSGLVSQSVSSLLPVSHENCFVLLRKTVIFIPKKSARDAAELFHILARKVETYNKGRSSFEMNYHLLGKGDASETRFAVGKIILNTMGCKVDQDDDDDNHPSSSRAERGHFSPSDSRLHQPNIYNPKKQQPIAKLSGNKKQNSATEKKSEDGSFLELEQQKEVVSKQHIGALSNYSCPKMEDYATEKPQEMSVSQSPTQKLVCKLGTATENEKFPSELEAQNPKEKLNIDAVVQVDNLITKEQSVDRRKQARPLSSLFK
ncbi:Poly A polymerase, head domain-containing protein, partial [Cynara cardunculus var. scolymus]